MNPVSNVLDESVPGPSHSLPVVIDTYQVTLTEGTRVGDEVVQKYQHFISGQLEKCNLAGRKRPAGELADLDVEEILNRPDSASEVEEQELDQDNDRASNPNLIGEYLIPIESNYSALKVFRDQERELLLSNENTQLESQYLGVGGTGQMAEVALHVEQGFQEMVVYNCPLESGQVTNVELQMERAVVGENGERDRNVFEWQDNFKRFTGRKEIYSKEPGPTNHSTCPYELFTSVWDNDIVDLIVDETNRYAWQTIAPLTESEGGLSPSCQLNHWKETNRDEMYIFFSILIYMSICDRAGLDEYWTNRRLEMPGFRSLMSRDRFQILLKLLHFADNQISIHTKTSYEKKIAKIATIVDHCNVKFRELYVAKQYLSLDESLLLWKGTLSWTQCIRTKAPRSGIKSFDLCESDTGYLLKTMLYAGKDSSAIKSFVCGFGNTRAKIVLKLVEPYLDMGHVLVMDNWYNQLPLTRYLKTRHTDVVGTQSRRQKGVPDCIQSLVERRMPKGQVLAQHCGDISVIAWSDVRLLTMVSTYHTNEVYRGQKDGQADIKPVVVRDYNAYMGGVDLKDQCLSLYPMERKIATKWYIKVFRRLVNTSLLNAFIMYRINHLRSEESQKLMTHRQFRYAVADLLIHRHTPQLPARPKAPLFSNTPRRLDHGQHLLVSTTHIREPSRDGYARKKRRLCARCSAAGRKRQVSTTCSLCKVALCIGTCFDEYHRLDDLSKKN